jgi:ATP-dependent DNA helicase MPH1
MNGTNGTASKQSGSTSKPNKYEKDAKLQDIVQELERQLHQPGGFTIHPKMDKMRTLLVEHFAQKKFDKEDAQINGGGEHLSGDSRVMVFVSFRQSVDEVIALLESEKPLIRAVPFIGQGTDKNGKRGYGQKEQLEV